VFQISQYTAYSVPRIGQDGGEGRHGQARRQNLRRVTYS
jgi:hypothetical protein